jgi:hypothetical protein
MNKEIFSHVINNYTIPTIKTLPANRYKEKSPRTFGATATTTAVPQPVATHKEKSRKLKMKVLLVSV